MGFGNGAENTTKLINFSNPNKIEHIPKEILA